MERDHDHQALGRNLIFHLEFNATILWFVSILHRARLCSRFRSAEEIVRPQARHALSKINAVEPQFGRVSGCPIRVGPLPDAHKTLDLAQLKCRSVTRCIRHEKVAQCSSDSEYAPNRVSRYTLQVALCLHSETDGTDSTGRVGRGSPCERMVRGCHRVFKPKLPHTSSRTSGQNTTDLLPDPHRWSCGGVGIGWKGTWPWTERRHRRQAR